MAAAASALAATANTLRTIATAEGEQVALKEGAETSSSEAGDEAAAATSGATTTTTTTSCPKTGKTQSGSNERNIHIFDNLGGPLQVLRDNAIGLFVRLRVDRAYCVAQILEIYEDSSAEYDLGDCESLICS